ncbi:MAG: BON domain-containing protein [Terriglobales bacterium]
MLLLGLTLLLAAQPVAWRAQQPSPAALRSTVLQTLINDPELGPYALAASVTPARAVTLNGTLPSKQDKQLAGNLVRSIAGVTGVHNQIRVAAAVRPLVTPASASPAKNALRASGCNTAGCNAKVAAAIRARLAGEPRLAGVEATVEREGVVLTGTVADAATRERVLRLASAAAHSITPFPTLVNRIEIHNH